MAIVLNFQAYCTGHAGRSEPSFGRRKREVENDESGQLSNSSKSENNTAEDEEQVREMIEV